MSVRRLFSMILPGIALTMGLSIGQANALPAVNGSFGFASVGGSQTYSPNNISFTQFTWTLVKVNSGQTGDFGSTGTPCCTTATNTLISSSTTGTTSISFHMASDGSPTSQTIAAFLSWTDNAGDFFQYDVSSWTSGAFPAFNTAFLNTSGTLYEDPFGNATCAGNPDTKPACATGPAIANFAFNQSGNTVNGNGTLSSGSFAIGTPEPASLMVLGSALAGLGL